MTAVQIAAFSYRTDADIRRIIEGLASQGARWVDQNLISLLVRINAPGGNYSDRHDYDPSLGVYLHAGRMLVLYRAKRELESGTSGRPLMLNTFWVVNPDQRDLLRLCFGPIRALWERDTPKIGSPELFDLPVPPLKPEGERLKELLDKKSSAAWFDAWLYLVQQLSVNKTPVSIPDLHWTQDAILDLAEAVILALPLSWRERASFATSMLDPQPKVPALKFAPQNKSAGTPDDKWPGALVGTGDPKKDYTRLLADAYRKQWLPELVEKVTSLRDDEVGANDQTLLNNLYPKISGHYPGVQMNNQLPTIKIGVWGLPAAGKSMYFIVYGKGEHNHQKGWTVTADADPTLGVNTQQWLDDHYYRILGQQDTMTAKTTSQATYCLEVQGKDRLGRHLAGLIRWEDAPGDAVILAMDELKNSLKACDAILCFIDPTPSPGPLDYPLGAASWPKIDPRMVQRERFKALLAQLLPGAERAGDDQRQHHGFKALLERVFRSGHGRGLWGWFGDHKIPQILAIIVTKVDCDPQYWNMRSSPETLLSTALGDPDIIKFIKNHCAKSRYRVFACSTVGVLDKKETTSWESNTKRITDNQGEIVDVIKDIVHWHPVGIGEPIQYVMTRYGNRHP